MPFQSEKQRRYLHANHPEIAKRWERDYANGGISNHFRKRFFKGAQADTQGPAGGQAMSPGTSTTGGTRHGGGGGNSVTGGGEPPIILNPPKGPTAAELAAREEARLQAFEDARRNQIYENTMDRRKKNIEYYDENLKTDFDITPVAKGVDTAADLYRTYKAIKGLKDLNPYGWLAGRVLKTVTGYRDGGILDIDASEEIISDDGNDIELTAYNAAFDEPTGVKSLFQAKDGGTPQLAKKSKDGKRPGYGGPHDSYDAGQSYSGSQNTSGGQYHGGGADVMSTSTKTSSPNTDRTRIQKEKQEEFQKQQFKDATKGTLSDPEEKYDTWEQEFQDIPGTLEGPQTSLYKNKVNVTYTRDLYEKALANQKAKLKKMGLSKLIMPALMIAFGVPPSVALKSITVSPKDLMTAVKHSLPVMNAKKELIEALGLQKGALLGQVDILNPNEMKSKMGIQISDITNEINDLTRTPEDDTQGDGGIELPPQLGGPSTEEMATEYQDDWYGAIKEKQAQQKAFKEKIESEKLAREGNPIVSGTETDIIALRNSGGLANLFRVKNQ